MSRLPDFLIAGAMRSGTTSLANWLRQHPDVGVAPVKEIHFFDQYFHRGLDWYRDQFPSGGYAVIGEATPNYCYHPDAMGRIATHLPAVRLVMLLRNPVDRAYSHYWHNRSRGKEQLSFEQALEAERERLEQDEVHRAWYSYVDRGNYVRQLEKMVQDVPRSHVGVFFFDDLERDPSGTFGAICDFIGVEVGPGVSEPRVVNRYVEFRSVALRRMAKRVPGLPGRALARLNSKRAVTYPSMAEGTRARLLEHFAPVNRELEEWLGVSLPDWEQAHREAS